MENFNLIAKDYDTDKRMERAKMIAAEIRLHVIDGRKKSAIDYGCGTGLVGLELINDFDSMTFADSSPGMIEQVRQKLSRLGKPVSSALCCDFMASVPHGLKADYIFSSLALHHIKDTELILSRLYGALHSAGHLLIVDLSKDDGGFHAKHHDFDGHNGFEPSALIKIATKAGFVNAEAKVFYHGEKEINGGKAPYSFFILNAKK